MATWFLSGVRKMFGSHSSATSVNNHRIVLVAYKGEFGIV